MNIVLSGASRGIGFETAFLLAANPDNKIIAIARSKEKLEHLCSKCMQEYGTKNIKALAFDLQEFGNYENLSKEVYNYLPNIDILINNAGVLINKEFEFLESDDFDKIFAINAKAPFMLIKQLLPFFSGNAHIVNISTMGAYQGSVKFKGLSLYSASKGALAVLTECLAEELKNKTIKVNCLALGATDTEMLQEAFPGYKAPVSAGEMALFVADFAEKGHRFFNGKILPVSLSTP